MATHIALGSLAQKQNNGSASPSKQTRRLKIELSDKIFQLKKLEQDYAEEKAHLLIQFNHEKTHLNSTIRELRDKIVEDNEHWGKKIDQLRLESQVALRRNDEMWQARVQGQVQRHIREIRSRYEAEIAELRASLLSLNQTIKQKQKAHERKVHNLKQIHRSQISQLKSQHESQLEQTKKKLNRDEELKITAIMHIKNSEQKEHTNTKNLMLRKEKDMSQQIRKLEEKVFALGQEIWGLNNRIKGLEEENQDKREEIKRLEDKRKDAVQMTNKEYQEKIQKSETEWKENLCSLNEKWKNEYKKLQLAFERITNACAQKQRLWEERGSKVLKLYELREAREEDVKLIEHLEVQLIKKQFQLERQKQELKTCKLELDNMDDIYKRIFHSVKKNHRHSHSFQLKKMRLPGIMNRSTHPLKEDQD